MNDGLLLPGSSDPTRSAAEEAALAAYPQLQRLIDLRDSGGWSFQPLLVGGELELLTGTRVWPLGWSDAIAIRALGDAKGFRCDPTGGEVWKREGGLVDVLDGLVELPVPDDPKAPRLVKARRPELWIPPGLGTATGS